MRVIMLCLLFLTLSSLVAGADVDGSKPAATGAEQLFTLENVDFPIPPSHELKVAFKVIANELEEGDDTDFVSWLNRRKQCNATAYFHLHNLRKDPTNYYTQNTFFESLMQCRRFDDMEKAARGVVGSILKKSMLAHPEAGQLTSENFEKLEDLLAEDAYETLGLGMGNTHDWWGTAVLLASGGNTRHDEVEKHMQLALDLAGTEVDMWPTYCMHWRRLEKGLDELATGEHTSLRALERHMKEKHNWLIRKDDMAFWSRWAPEILSLGVGARTDPAQAKLLPLVMELRRVECSWQFIYSQCIDFTAGRKTIFQEEEEEVDVQLPPVVYTALNHQYGTFFWNGFSTLVQHPQVQRAAAAIKADPEKKLRVYMLGSNIGNEAFYSAIGHGLPTIGVEIICNLVERAKAFQAKYAPDAPLEFRCDDAGQTDVSNAGLVYLDNEVWDPDLNAGLKTKLVAEMPIGGIIVGTSKWAPFEVTAAGLQADNSPYRHVVQIGTEVEAGSLTSWGTEFYLFQIKEGRLPSSAGPSSAGTVADEEEDEEDEEAGASRRPKDEL